MTTEPKRYAAKEAMHWMIDHPTETMVINETGRDIDLYRFVPPSGWFEYQNEGHINWHRAATCFGPYVYFYIRTEYDAWQAALAAEAYENKILKETVDHVVAHWNAEDDKLPRVGESLFEHVKRSLSDSNWPFNEELFDTHQRWIEANFVRREGR